MNVAQLADQLRRDNQFMKDVTRWEVIPARPAQTAPFPDSLDPRLIPVLAQRGIHSLYTHQARSPRGGRDRCYAYRFRQDHVL